VLRDQPDAGRTILEKFEHYAKVGFAIALLTPDDLGGSQQTPQDAKLRARQNVLFELGYFIGKLGRRRVCVLHKEGVEIPSDYLGVLYITVDHSSEWKHKLAREMQNAGLPIDLNKVP
jgi:predicted nucleotide-binding protein